MAESYFDLLTSDDARLPMSVEELTSRIKAALEDEFGNVWVEGEVVNFTAAASGHWYFNLNDGKAQIRCVCWKGTNFRIRFRPENGIQVRIRGKVSFYTARGETQLVVESLEPSGEGALRAAFEQIRSKLDNEGLFAPELKRPIPFFPNRVGIVTSRTGAAFHDILSVLTRRAMSISILLLPTLVQGEGAADSIRNAITAANLFSGQLPPKEKLDVLIVGRGGGSAEDLWAFNDEALARAIRASSIPVISAVGHEIDWTISDLVADLRAATPSAAAELVAGREEDILATLSSTETRCFEIAKNRTFAADVALNSLSDRLTSEISDRFHTKRNLYNELLQAFSPSRLVGIAAEMRRQVDLLANRAGSAAVSRQTACTEAFSLQVAKLDSLSPLAVLSRGYSLVQTLDGRVLRMAEDVAVGDRIGVRPGNGRLTAEVVEVDPK
ncbi:MAG: exodeoxyribonuclease VII large subunit [Acidobacteriota bacterium]|nr:MAG: exodeoxyribonuclease VII large subunit [Acidobacteriota bacterium]